MNRRSLLVAARALAIIVLVAAAVPILLELLGFAPAPALRALLVGSIGSFDALVSATLVRVTPLMLTGLAVAVAFRAGVFNIGAEGQLLTGAACAAAVGLAGRGSLPGAIALPFELIAGAIGGASWAAIAAVLRARFRVLEVISTILLNFIALYLVSYLVRGPLQEPLHIYPQSEALPADARLPRVIAGSRLHAGFPLAIATAMILWWYVRFTAGGFRLRVVGANPDAARSAGEIDVARMTIIAFLVSGALAGLAGAIEVTGVTFALYENISPGYGYTGIAVALLARLGPLAVIPSAMLFGALEAGATAMQRDAGVPSVVVSIAEAAIILGLVVLSRVSVVTGAGRRGSEREAPEGEDA